MGRYKLEIKWGLLFVLMTLLWLVMERVAGFHSTRIDKHPIVTNFIFIPAIAIFVLALREKRKLAGGVLTFQQGFVTGVMITVIVTVLSPLTQSLVSLIITPHFFENAIAFSVEQGKLDREKAEQYFNLKSYIIQGLMGAPVMGLITSVIVAFFCKSKSSPA